MDDDIRDELMQENFSVINPADYAKKLKTKFKKNPDLWFTVISPKMKAEELRNESGNDYSKVWHVHCYNCWESIDKNTKATCYISDDEFIWLCKECYNELLNKNNE